MILNYVLRVDAKTLDNELGFTAFLESKQERLQNELKLRGIIQQDAVLGTIQVMGSYYIIPYSITI